MIYSTEPSDFKSRFDIVSCFVKKGDDILLLHRQKNKPQGDTWGIPAGKIDEVENLLDAIQRELKEETGISLTKDEIRYVDKVYTRYPEFDFIFHMFYSEVPKNTVVKLSPTEHSEYIWIKPEEVHMLNLMEDIGECIERYCQ